MGKTYIFKGPDKNKPKRTKDRRAAPRIPAAEVLPHAVTRLATGQEVELMNISLNGALLINTSIMLSPGACIRLKMAMPGANMNLDGRVQRCKVIGLKHAKIQYEAAVILDKGFPRPLADKLGLSNTQTNPSNSSNPAGINPAKLPLHETAELWVLNAKEA